MEATTTYIELWKFSSFKTESNSLKAASKLIENPPKFFRIHIRPQTVYLLLYLQKFSLTQWTLALLYPGYTNA